MIGIVFIVKKYFHFYNLDDREVRWINSAVVINEQLFTIYEECECYKLNKFDYTDYTHCDFEGDLDPDNNFYSNVYVDCRYFTDVQFKDKIEHKSGLSIVHLNSRSLVSNIGKLMII